MQALLFTKYHLIFALQQICSPLFLNQAMYSILFDSQDQNEEEKDVLHISNLPSPSPSSIQFSSNSHMFDGKASPNQFNNDNSPLQTTKGSRKSRKNSQEPKNMNRGHWSTQQNKKYHWFLQIHYRHFVNRHMRRMDKIFKTMELFVGTRQAEQCRSHHQKMQKKYLNFITIISNLRQQHYNSLDIEPILQDMDSNFISAGEGLATIEQLRLQESSVPIPSEYKQRKKSTASKMGRQQMIAVKEYKKQEMGMQEQKIQQGNFNANMLDESNMNVGQFIVYHEKDDNSCLFNSLLQNDL